MELEYEWPQTNLLKLVRQRGVFLDNYFRESEMGEVLAPSRPQSLGSSTKWRRETVLVRYKSAVTIDEAEALLVEEGLQMASWLELCVLAIKCVEERVPPLRVVAPRLGVCNGNGGLEVPTLSHCGYEWHLVCCPRTPPWKWTREYNFLTVPAPSRN